VWNIIIIDLWNILECGILRGSGLCFAVLCRVGSTMRLPRVALITLGILLFEHCTTVTLTRVTQQRKDAPRPNPALLVLLTEFLKLAMSACLEVTCCFGIGSGATVSAAWAAVCGSPWDTLRLSVPAALYTIQNLAIYVALGHLEVCCGTLTPLPLRAPHAPP
jgi:hypothetical protein